MSGILLLAASGGSGLDDYSYGVGTQTINSQIVLPATAAEGSGVAGFLQGCGPSKSKLVAHSSITGALVTTEDYEDGGVLHAGVADLFLDGDQGVADVPWTNVTELGLDEVADAIKFDSAEAVIQGNRIHDFRGAGIRFVRSTSSAQGRIPPPLIESNRISKCWTGIYIGDSVADSQIYNNCIADCRDIGIYDIQGATQSSGNHCYGMRIGIQVGQEVLPETGNGPSRFVGDTFSDTSEWGFKNYASGTQIIAGKTEHCVLGNIYCYRNTWIDDTIVRIMRGTLGVYKTIGVYMGGNASRIDGGTIYCNDYTFPGAENPGGCIGVQVGWYGMKVHTRIEGGSTSGANTTGVEILGTGGQLYDLDINVQINGFTSSTDCWGVDIGSGALAAGSNSRIIINGATNQSARLIRIPAGWAGATIIVNGTTLTPGTAYP